MSATNEPSQPEEGGNIGTCRILRSRSLLLLCLVGLLARLLTAAVFPNVIHADETFQYLEQANRLVVGRGMVPWEYVAGIRSWLIPGAMVPVVWAAHQLPNVPMTLTWALSTSASIASLAIVAAVYVIGYRAAGRNGAVASGLLVALWPETVLMSPHILADTICAIPFIVGIALGYGEQRSGRSMVGAGLLIALASLLRPQLIPTALVALFWLSDRRFSRLRMLIAGGAIATAVYGLVDWVALGFPFASLYGYVRANGGGIASYFGTEPVYYYAANELMVWNWAAILIAFTARAGSRRAPLILVLVSIFFLSLSVVPHKENRFIYPAIPLILCLCGIGTARAIAWWQKNQQGRGTRLFPVLLAGLWVAAAFTAATRPLTKYHLTRNREVLSGISLINSLPRVCGVGVIPTDYWWLTGTARFRPDIGLYEQGRRPLAALQAFNSILLIGGRSTPSLAQAGFRTVACYPGEFQSCVLVRQSPCDVSLGTPLSTSTGPELDALIKQAGLRPPVKSSNP